MREAEATIQHSILQAWGAHPGLRLWRQNTGVGWFANGKPARQKDPGAYPVAFGLPGQGDLSGLVFRRDGVGQRIEIECKTSSGRQSDEQKAFGAMITRFGGIYLVARSLTDVDAFFATLGISR